ncbi:MAG: cytochrome P450 [Spirulina sp. SIO3F2]|nr:cytochrome P450 [Spirulina sp. SIO3F2]
MMDQLPNCIDGPPWLQLLNWTFDPIGFLDKNYQKYGDIFTMRSSASNSCIFIGNPHAIQELFDKESNFDTGRNNAEIKLFVGQNSLLSMDGKRHRRERKLLMPPFHGERLKSYTQQICLATERIAGQWRVGKTFVAHHAMREIVLATIMKVVLGSSQVQYYRQLQSLISSWFNILNSPLFSITLFFAFLRKDFGTWTPWGQMKKRQRKIRKLLQEEIEYRRKNSNEQKQDLLGLMMAARDKSGQAMADDELIDELFTILFGGLETTAAILTWALYEIHYNPDVCEKLRQELDDVESNSDLFEITQLSYLTAVCKETLRMYPISAGTLDRIANSSVEIAGYLFEPETVLIPVPYLVHCREDLYPDARSFKPERFLGRRYSSFEYLPFGGGSRRCLGEALAQLELKLVLGTILSKYQLSLVAHKPVSIRRYGFIMAPKGGIKMVMTGKR